MENQKKSDEPWYNIPSALRLHGNVRVKELEKAVQRVAHQYPGLTATYRLGKGGLARYDRNTVQPPFYVENVAGVSEDEVNRKVAEATRLPFNLNTTGPLRVHVFVHAPEDVTLLVTVHHISSDFRSQSVLLQRIIDEYIGRQGILYPRPIEHDRYIAKENSLLSSARREELERFWSQELDGADQAATIPLDVPRSESTGYLGAWLEETFPMPTWTELVRIARAHNSTVFTVLSAAHSILVWKWSGAADFVVVTPLTRRVTQESQYLVGYLVNPIAIRSRIAPELSFGELLERQRQTLLSAYRHGSYPFALLPSCVSLSRRDGQPILGQTALNLEVCESDLPVADLWAAGDSTRTLRYDDLEIRARSTPHHAGTFDLTVKVIRSGASTRIIWIYDTALFHTSTIRTKAREYLGTLQQVAADPDVVVADLARA